MENIPMLPVFFRYCRRMGRAFLLAGLGFGMLFLVTILYRAPIELPLYACSLVGTVGLLFFGFGFGRYYRRHAALRMLLAQCGTKLAELPEPRDLLDEDYHALIETLEANRIAAEAEAARQQSDASEYYALWSHQIKTPLAAMRLLLQDSPELARRGAFAQELFLAEQYADMVLGYQRLASIHADLDPRALALEPLVRETVKRMSTLFIYNKNISLQIAPLPGTIVTDAKWFSFVLEQLLTNAVKYTPAGMVRIYPDAAAPDTLVIEDTGIGIRAEELPRIFERGFTGGNGRGGQRSTGIGLYLCREVLQKLGHTIAITSTPGVGTVVRVGYAREGIEVE
ncbi:MAG: HAMP domain-containing histidine kinase [Subdoligranulum sp.]|nr:HAMP domain-containing histidine kinase [Subdoligranulum sp.]MBD5101434.1 HAMP domain-containing histidine kinase [Subdoligranulum sp.]